MSLGFVNRRLRHVGRVYDELRMEANANVQVPKAKSRNKSDKSEAKFRKQLSKKIKETRI